MRLFQIASFLAALVAGASARAELTSRELLLVVNRNVPASVELARHYAQVRDVPAERVLELDLPAGDEISADDYELKIADPIRARLAHESGSIRCIVTFYGVPFRVAPRSRSAEETNELKEIAAAARHVDPKLSAAASEAERLAKLTNPAFAVLKSEGDQSSLLRVRHAAMSSLPLVAKVQDPAQRADLEAQWKRLSEALEKPITPPPPSTAPANAPGDESNSLLGTLALRQLARDRAAKAGVVSYAAILEAQRDFLMTQQNDAAVDSELAAVQWGMYRRREWQGNPLHVGADRRVPGPPTMMVMRLDGPSPQTIRRMIDDSIATEREGLAGRVLLDSWNKPLRKPDGSPDGYGVYDESIRRLRDLLSQERKIELAFDSAETVVPEKSQNNLGIYCGWYEPNRVVLPGTFERGAVAFHIASYTAVGLHGQGGGWWVPALLDAGACATFGPVSEPYLHAFPEADTFVPLLMTGKFTLAETYWLTTPLASWKMLAIGDPLYKPYAKNPPLMVSQLPARLRRVVQ